MLEETSWRDIFGPRIWKHSCRGWRRGMSAGRCHEQLELCWNAMNDQKNGDQQVMEVANKSIRFAGFEGKGSNFKHVDTTRGIGPGHVSLLCVIECRNWHPLFQAILCDLDSDNNRELSACRFPCCRIVIGSCALSCWNRQGDARDTKWVFIPMSKLYTSYEALKCLWSQLGYKQLFSNDSRPPFCTSQQEAVEGWSASGLSDWDSGTAVPFQEEHLVLQSTAFFNLATNV